MLDFQGCPMSQPLLDSNCEDGMEQKRWLGLTIIITPESLYVVQQGSLTIHYTGLHPSDKPGYELKP